MVIKNRIFSLHKSLKKRHLNIILKPQKERKVISSPN